MSTTTPNMTLILPAVGETSGPDYAIIQNNDLQIIDQHDHSPGQGVAITPAGININTALNFSNNFITSAAGLTLQAQGSPPPNQTVYVSGTDLYFVDGVGNDVRLTQSGGVAGSPGSIANLVSPASATYVAGNSTFVWQSNTSTAADMDVGSVILRNITPNSTFGLTLQPPSALSSNYTITLPALPAATSAVTITPSGTIATVPFGFLVPTGTLLPYAAASAPAGYLLANGAAVSRSTYADLFGVCGTTYGAGDGSTTFNLPNMNGRVAMGAGNYTDPTLGSVTRTLGVSLGEASHVMIEAEIASHTHTQTAHNHPVLSGAGTITNPSTGYGLAAFNGTSGGYVSNGTVGGAGNPYLANIAPSIQNAGSNSPMNVVQPSLVISYIIKI